MEHHQAAGRRRSDLITNELIDEINKFDAAKVTAEAKAYRAGG